MREKKKKKRKRKRYFVIDLLVRSLAREGEQAILVLVVSDEVDTNNSHQINVLTCMECENCENMKKNRNRRKSTGRDFTAGSRTPPFEMVKKTSMHFKALDSAIFVKNP